MTAIVLPSVIALALAASACCAAYTRADFDAADALFNKGDGVKTGLGEQLAWGESYLMLAYVDMYRATHDTRYLDKLVDHADHVLASRDDNRGFRDYSGRSRPAWSVAGVYTVAELVLKGADGRDALKLRSTRYAYNNQTTVRVRPRPESGRFDLLIENEYWKTTEEFAGLSMDRSSPDFIERRVNARDWVAPERKLAFSDKGSSQVTVEALGGGVPATDAVGRPLADRQIALEPLFMAYHGYSGMITFPMLDFALLVRSDPGLPRRYRMAADRYVDEAVRVFRDAEEEWRDGPRKHEGYYVFGRRGCPFWADNVPKPFNYLGSEGLSLLRLYRLTGDSHWKARASAVARLFKRHLQRDASGAYVWCYWWGPISEGWTRKNSPSMNTPTWAGQDTIEDTSHGCLEVYFAAQCAQAGLVFDAEDMHGFAATFLRNVVDPRSFTMSERVNGEGRSGVHDAMVGYWMELAAWEPRVASVALEIAKRQDLRGKAYGSAMLSLARAIRWSDPSTSARQ